MTRAAGSGAALARARYDEADAVNVFFLSTWQTTTIFARTRRRRRGMTRGHDAPVAAFHRALAVALCDAKAPGEVMRALSLARRVLLPDDDGAPRAGAEIAATLDGDAEDALTAAAAAARRASSSSSSSSSTPSSSASRWDGFERAGEEMLFSVAARWLPCMSASQRSTSFDAIVRAMPAPIATRVLVPALSPSRGGLGNGRGLSDGEKRAVATEAARALSRAIDDGLARRLASGEGEEDEVRRMGTSVWDGDDANANANANANESLALLLSAADRLELPPGSHPSAAALRPSTLARAVAAQVIDAARASSSTSTSTSTRGRRAESAAAFALARLCRRGHADEAADALLASLVVVDDDGDGDGRPRVVWANSLVAAMTDAHAAAKLAASALAVAASPDRPTGPMRWRAIERCLRHAFGERFWACDVFRHALCDGLLLRRAIPRAAAAALLRFALVSPPPPPPTTTTTTTTTRAGEAADAEDVLIRRHKETTAAAIVDAWADEDAVRMGGGKINGQVASVMRAAIAACDPLEARRFFVTGANSAAVMRGVSARLDSPAMRVRVHGQKVAIALARAVDPGRPLTFAEDEVRSIHWFPYDRVRVVDADP